MYVHHHHHHHHHQVLLRAGISLTLSIFPSLPAGLPDYILCTLIVVVGKFLLVSQPWYVHMNRSIEECHLWVCPCLSNKTQHVFFVILGYFVMGVSACTAAGSWGVAFRIYSIKLLAFLCSSCQAFSLYVLSASTWCIHTVMLKLQLLGRNPALLKMYLSRKEWTLSF